MLRENYMKKGLPTVLMKLEAVHNKSERILKIYVCFRGKIISMKFMRKYILICKNLKPPKLTEEACDVISEEYSRLRSQDTANSDVARTQPITARTLETLIRLSTAHAKARFSRNVEVEDANAAIELVQYAIFRKVLEKDKKKKRQRGEDSDEEVEQLDTEEQQPPKRTRSTAEVDEYENIASQEQSAPVPTLREMRQRKTQPTITDERLTLLKSGVVKAFMSTHRDSLPLPELKKQLKDINLEFTEDEMSAGLAKMSDDNQIMVSDDIVFLI